MIERVLAIVGAVCILCTVVVIAWAIHDLFGTRKRVQFEEEVEELMARNGGWKR